MGRKLCLARFTSLKLLGPGSSGRDDRRVEGNLGLFPVCDKSAGKKKKSSFFFLSFFFFLLVYACGDAILPLSLLISIDFPTMIIYMSHYDHI